MYNKIAKKNPLSLTKKDDQDLEYEKAKKDCEDLIEEIGRTSKIIKVCDFKDKLKVRAIHSNKNKVKEELDAKYNDLRKRLERDYATEWFLLLKMFMQQELAIFKGTEQRIENYILTSQPLKK